MGLRSWFTTIEDKMQWYEFKEALEKNDYADDWIGFAFCMDGTPVLGNKFVVKWLGDGDGSCDEEMPLRIVANTIWLEDLQEVCPDWNTKEGVEKYLIVYNNEEEFIKRLPE